MDSVVSVPFRSEAWDWSKFSGSSLDAGPLYNTPLRVFKRPERPSPIIPEYQEDEERQRSTPLIKEEHGDGSSSPVSDDDGTSDAFASHAKAGEQAPHFTKHQQARPENVEPPSSFFAPRPDVNKQLVPTHGKLSTTKKLTLMGDVGETSFSMLDPETVASAPKDRSGSYLFSYLLFRGPNKEHVKCHYHFKRHGSEARAKSFLKCKVVGLHTEFKTGCVTKFKDGVSLIQIASETDIALLKKLLESPKILKTGSNVQCDATKIETYYDCKGRGVVGLKQLLHSVHPDEKGQKASLDTMTRRYFGLGLDKGYSQRSQNWSGVLSAKQMEYAASDAYASLKVFQTIDRERQDKRLASVPTLMALSLKETPWTIAKRKRKVDEGVPETMYEALHKLRLLLGDASGVDGSRIMTNAMMRTMVRTEPKTTAEILAIPHAKNSRFDLFADEILEVIGTYSKGTASKRQKTQHNPLTSRLDESQDSSGEREDDESVLSVKLETPLASQSTAEVIDVDDIMSDEVDGEPRDSVEECMMKPRKRTWFIDLT